MCASVASGITLAFVLLIGTFSTVSCQPAPEKVQEGQEGVNLPLEETAFGGDAVPAENVRQARAPTFFPSVVRVYPSYGYYPYGYYGGNRILIHKRVGYGYSNPYLPYYY